MFETPKIRSRLLRIVEQQITPQEKIGWVGQPVPLLYGFQEVWDFLWLIPTLAAPFLFVTFFSRSPAPDTVRLASLLALGGVGLNLIFFLGGALQAMRIIYVITDQRALTITPYAMGLGRRRSKSLGHQHMGIIECEDVYIGTLGNVIFKRTTSVQYSLVTLPRSSGRRFSAEKIGFFAVRDACAVAQALSRLTYIVNKQLK
jgi:hypothetical protein